VLTQESTLALMVVFQLVFVFVLVLVLRLQDNQKLLD
jgi:hypothetical protein